MAVVTKHMKVYRNHVATPNGRSLTIEYRTIAQGGIYIDVRVLNHEGQLLLVPPQTRLNNDELISLMEDLMGCGVVHLKETLRAD